LYSSSDVGRRILLRLRVETKCDEKIKMAALRRHFFLPGLMDFAMANEGA
jgi:hypothetical protein